MATIRDHTELRVFREALAAAVDVYRLTADRGTADRWLIGQMRRSAAAVPANTAEAWGKRRYPRSFAASLVVAQGEAGEARFWLQYAVALGLAPADRIADLDARFRVIRAQLLAMSEDASRWSPPTSRR